MADEPHAPCPICIGPVIRRKRETRLRWSRRIACSVPCANKLRSKTRRKIEVTPKLCAICPDEFTIRPDEAPRDFTRRQTCGSEDCYKELMERKYNGTRPDRADWHIEKWPVDYAGGFGRAEVDPGDKRGSIPLRPATHVATEANT